MTNHIKDITQSKTLRVDDITLRKAALIAGFGLLIMTIAAIFAEFARTSLIVVGDVTTPGYNISIAMVTFIGEFLLMFWLLFKGSKIQEDRA